MAEHSGDRGGLWSSGDRLTILHRGRKVEGGYFVGYISPTPSTQIRCRVQGDSGREYVIYGAKEASFNDFDILAGDK